MENTKFVSKSKNLKLTIGDKLIEFVDLGGYGVLETNDEELIEKLKSHPDFKISGIGAFTIGSLPKSSSNVVQGARGYREGEDLKKLFKEYDTLKTEIVTVSGDFRKGVTEDQKIKFEKLKLEIGL
jgi:hypothetical protein